MVSITFPLITLLATAAFAQDQGISEASNSIATTTQMSSSPTGAIASASSAFASASSVLASVVSSESVKATASPTATSSKGAAATHDAQYAVVLGGGLAAAAAGLFV
ncbi:hypothetical protein N0V83_009287 [Neocucurbitaria cava]|uniref:Uncharacterized protein n=1 Tax=Neocucurbitaria cava TaxID=798079 RepID=A0A9W8Y3N5_9PLEO|nr:hypothetical protein N0V83_009287 [Neocucurbitaria cava]